MTDDVAITKIEKGNRVSTHQEYHIEGTVGGEQVSVRADPESFQQMERKGADALREWLKDGLEAVHRGEREKRR